MKVLLLIIVVFLGLFSCSKDETFSALGVRRIVNKTNHDAELFIYKSDSIVSQETIRAMDSTSLGIGCQGIGSIGSCLSELDFLGNKFSIVDSAAIIFESGRRIIHCAPRYVCGADSLNFFRRAQFLNNGELVIYTITDSDYEKAIPIAE
jgi:hypothetical protein